MKAVLKFEILRADERASYIKPLIQVWICDQEGLNWINVQTFFDLEIKRNEFS